MKIIGIDLEGSLRTLLCQLCGIVAEWQVKGGQRWCHWTGQQQIPIGCH